MKRIIMKGDPTMMRSIWQGILIMVLVGLSATSMPAATLYVAKDQTPQTPYTNGWGSAASNIQDAVNAAATNDTILVAPGRYTFPPNAVGSNVVYIAKPLSLRSSNSVPAGVVIDGQGLYRGVQWDYFAATTNRFLLDGFTISNCFAATNGGGIYFNSHSWTAEVQNCVISGNIAMSPASNTLAAGGGLYGFPPVSLGWGITLSNCVIRGNLATNKEPGTATVNNSMGGGLYLRGTGQKTITGCLIEDNVAEYAGGVHMTYSPASVENCIIRRNMAPDKGGVQNNEGGGGMFLNCQNFLMRNCLMYDNQARVGGGIYKLDSSGVTGLLEVASCTIAGNSIGGIYFRRLCELRLYNSIIYSNANTLVAGSPVSFSNNWIVATYVTNGVNGAGNISNNPESVFADYAGKNFKLLRSSPCLNGGIYQAWMTGALELDGNPRLDRSGPGIVDIGAYEYKYNVGTLVKIQ